MRQLTRIVSIRLCALFSKLPMRQLTELCYARQQLPFSKLPMRQLTSTAQNEHEN